MKKQYFIFSIITCMTVIFNVKAQNTPIDDFLKKYPSKEGVTHVTMSQQMLQSIFPPSIIVNAISGESIKVPDSYSSVTVSKEDIPENLFTDFKKTLLSSKYEQFMEMNKENNSILGYYLKKVNDQTNEIVVLRHQKNQFSAIYIKGDIDINYVNHHLSMIKSALNRLGANQTSMFQHDHQFAFAMPLLEGFKMDFPNFHDFNFQFDNEAFKLRMEESKKLMEESMKNMKEHMKSREFEYNEDLQRNIQDAMENVQKQMEEVQRRMEED